MFPGMVVIMWRFDISLLGLLSSVCSFLWVVELGCSHYSRFLSLFRYRDLFVFGQSVKLQFLPELSCVTLQGLY